MRNPLLSLFSEPQTKTNPQKKKKERKKKREREIWEKAE